MFTWHDFVFICCNWFPYFDNIFFRIECFQNDDLNEYSVIQIYVWLNSQNKIFITVFLLFNSFCSKKNYPFDEIALLWCFFHYTLSVFLENRIWTAKCQLQTTEAVSRPWNVIKKKLQYRYFRLNFAKYLRAPFLRIKNTNVYLFFAHFSLLV